MSVLPSITQLTPPDLNRPLRFSFLGPYGTFTEQALGQIDPNDDAEHLPAHDAPRSIKMVIDKVADYAMVPIENSVEGGINPTIDALAYADDLVILAEVLEPVAFTLAVRPGTRLEDIKRISTHHAAWTQCRYWLEKNLPDVVYVPASSTAAGAQGLIEPDPTYQATLVSALAARRYGLTALAKDVADNPNAMTRFVLIGKSGVIPERTSSDKTTLWVELPHDEAGSLLKMLEQFSSRGVNLSRIESRPVGDAMGRYAFSIDADGHIHDERIRATLQGLYRMMPLVKYLGSYATADRHKIDVQAGVTDDDYASAREWVTKLAGQ